VNNPQNYAWQTLYVLALLDETGSPKGWRASPRRNFLIPRFDIFRIAGDDKPIWVESASTIDAARERARLLVDIFPGKYLIFDQTTGEKVLILPNDTAIQ
jgi:hypothetical protein